MKKPTFEDFNLTDEEYKINIERMKIINEMKCIENWNLIKLIKGEDYNISLEDYKSFSSEYSNLKEKSIKLYNNGEKLSEEEMFKMKELKNKLKIPKVKLKRTKEYRTKQNKDLEREIELKHLKKEAKNNYKNNEEYLNLKSKLNEINKIFKQTMEDNTEIRNLRNDVLTINNQISLFDNSLSRAFGFKENEVSMDLIVVRVYHYPVLKQIIKNGFVYNVTDGVTKKYKIFTASAGQIRTKKVIFIEESMWNKYEKTLMCGLTIEDLNKSKEQGCNINKFLAYLALCNSATDVWEGFDIDRAIVVEDFEGFVEDKVDYIDNKTFKVERKTMKVPIPYSDGCGMMLPKVSKKSFMVRLPWVKGLMTPVDYIKFCTEFNDKNYKIKDIYGKEYDLKKDNIQYIFSKSQFKMWKYYSSWDEYKTCFKQYNCGANMCNIEPNTEDFRQANFNYQMWQTLTNITNEEIKHFTDEVDEFITKGYSDRNTMLKLLGADKDNKKKTYMQQCLEIYPELINDFHVKEELASMLNARKKEAKFGKFKIDATYTFLIPDVFAWMQNLFLGEEFPSGLLEKNQVCCKLYKESKKLLVNRSPHLYREHAIRNNINNEETKKWFITDGIYTSTHDLISKMLQFDNDGDRALVVNDEELKKIAERNMEDIVPLYYEMGKAKPQIINENNIYESLISAFKYNNIGKFSNKLTVMWNKDEPDLTTIAQLTALNNFTIDCAKTLLVPEVPDDVNERMKESDSPMPYFYQFAKNKHASEVEKKNNSTMNRICTNIENIKQGTYDFTSVGKMDYKNLMNNSEQEIDDNVISAYIDLNKKKDVLFSKSNNPSEETYSVIFNNVRTEFGLKCNELGYSIQEAIDMIVKYIYENNRESKKGFIFDIFGDIILNNLNNNVKKQFKDGYIMCKCCGKRVKNTNGKALYCKKCAKEINIKKTIKNKK